MSKFPLSATSAPSDLPSTSSESSNELQAIRTRTPARIFVGRAGPSYRTVTQLELRQDHAAALDAVHTELDLARGFSRDFTECWHLFEFCSRAAYKSEYLWRRG